MGEPNQILAEGEADTRKAYSVSMTGRQLLEYETPRKPPPSDPFEIIFVVAQRAIFAIGAGLFMYGLGGALTGNRSDVPEMMGWGAGLCALTMPWGWRRSKRTEN
jgi:hypothetical protein